jgi:hypothetical protein
VRNDVLAAHLLVRALAVGAAVQRRAHRRHVAAFRLLKQLLVKPHRDTICRRKRRWLSR